MTRNSLATLVVLAGLVSACGPTAPPAIEKTIHVGRDGLTVEDCVLASASVACELPVRMGDLIEIPLASPRDRVVRIEVLQREIDVLVALVSESGEVVSEVDSKSWSNGPEYLWAVLREGAVPRLRIDASASDEEAGQCSVRIVEEAALSSRREKRVAAWTEGQRALRECHEALEPSEVSGVPAACTEAEGIARRVGDPDLAAWTSLALADAHGRQRDHESALAELDRALRLWKEEPRTVGTAVALQLKAGALEKLGRYRDAATTLERVPALWREWDSPADEAYALNGLGHYLRLTGRRLEAAEHFERAAEIWLAGGRRDLAAFAYTNLGSVVWEMGLADAALSHYSRVEELVEPADGPRARLALTLALASKGEVLSNAGQYQEALANIERARELDPSPERPDTRASRLLNEANALAGLGKAREALERYEQARDLYRESGNRAREALLEANVGSVLVRLGEDERAFERFEAALALTDADETPELRGVVLHGRGAALLAGGSFEAAERDFREAARLRELGAELYGQADSMSMLGIAHQRSGELEPAYAAQRQSLALIDGAGFDQLRAVILGRLSEIADELGRAEEAIEAYREALEIFDRIRVSVVSDELRSSVSARRNAEYDRFVSLLLRQAEATGDRRSAQEAFGISERSRSRGLVELLAEAKVTLGDSTAQEFTQQQEALEQQGSILERRLRATGQSEKERSALTEELSLLRRRRLELRDELRQRSPEFERIVYPDPITVSEVQGLLPEDTALLEYTIGEDDAFVFAITRERFEVFRLPTAIEPLNELVGDFREAILRGGRRGGQGRLRSVAGDLYQSLLGPAGEVLGEVDKLIVVPAGSLFYLPFEALRLPEGATEPSQYLVQRYEVAYIPSATVLSQLPESGWESGAGPTLAVFANPAMDDAVHRGLPALAGAEREAREIAELVGAENSETFFGADASETNLRQHPAPRSARWLHFATHALIDEEEPANCRLVLSSPGDDRGDGYFDLSEVFSLDLAADLVVLSACDTGLGKHYSGEGLVGLSRGFFYAGARSLMVTLWPADDQRSARVMSAFYRALLDGAGNAGALRRAKLEAISDPGLSNPRYWAPFVLIGQ